MIVNSYWNKKSLLFFNLIPAAVFVCFIGFFSTLWLIFLTLYCVFTQVVYAQFVFFSSWGIAVYLVSLVLYKHKYFKTLKVPSYKAYVQSRNNLVFWIFWTTNVYLLLCWYWMIMLSMYNGFGITFPNNAQVRVLIDDPFTFKLVGLILWSVHSLLLVVCWFGKAYIKNLLVVAHQRLNQRRETIENARVQAKEIYK